MQVLTSIIFTESSYQENEVSSQHKLEVCLPKRKKVFFPDWSIAEVILSNVKVLVVKSLLHSSETKAIVTGGLTITGTGGDNYSLAFSQNGTSTNAGFGFLSIFSKMRESKIEF